MRTLDTLLYPMGRGLDMLTGDGYGAGQDGGSFVSLGIIQVKSRDAARKLRIGPAVRARWCRWSRKDRWIVFLACSSKDCFDDCAIECVEPFCRWLRLRDIYVIFSNWLACKES